MFGVVSSVLLCYVFCPVCCLVLSVSRSHTAPPLRKFCSSLGHTQPHRSGPPHSVSIPVRHRPNALLRLILSVSRTHTAPSFGSASFCPSLNHTQPHRSAPPHSVRLSVTHSPNAPQFLSVSRSHTAPPLRIFSLNLGHTQPHYSATICPSVHHTKTQRSAHSVRLSVTHSPTAPHFLSLSWSHTAPPLHIILSVSRSNTAPTLHTIRPSLYHTQLHSTAYSLRLSVTQSTTALSELSIRLSVTNSPTAPHILFVSRSYTAPTVCSASFCPSLGQTQPQRSAPPHSVSIPVRHRPIALLRFFLSVSRSHTAPPLCSASFCPSLGHTQPHRSARSVRLSATHSPTSPHILSVSRSHIEPHLRLNLSVSRSHTDPPIRTICASLGHREPQINEHNIRPSVTHSPTDPYILSVTQPQSVASFSPSLGHTAPKLRIFCQALGHTKPHRSVSLSVTQSPNAPHILSVSGSHTAPPLRTFCPSLGHT